MAGEQVVTEIIVDARQAKAGVLEYTEALSHAGEATDQFGNKISGGFSKAEKAADMYLARLDPAFNASQKLGRETTTISSAIDGLERQMMRGAITTDVYNQRMTLLQGRMAAVREASTGLAAGALSASNAMSVLSAGSEQHDQRLNRVGDTSKRVGFAMRDLGIQSQDFFVQLASGSNPMTAFIQQASQVAQVNQNMGVSMRDVGRELAAMAGRFLTNPFTLMALGIGSVAVALTVLAVNAETADRRLLALTNTMKATRTDAESAAQAADAAARNVAATSPISMEAARASSTAIQGAAQFTGTQADLERLIRTAGDLDAVFKKAGAGSDILIAAMKDAGAEAKKLADDDFPGMSRAIADAIQKAQDGGDRVGAFNDVLRILETRVHDSAEALTPLQTALSHLSDAFTATASNGESFAHQLGSEIAQMAASVVEGIARTIRAIKEFQAFVDSMTGGGGPLKPGENALNSPRYREPSLLDRFLSPGDQRGSNLTSQVEKYLQQQRMEDELGIEDLNLPTPPMPPLVRGQTVGDISASAQGRVDASTAGRVAALRQEIEKYRMGLSLLSPTMEGGQKQIDAYNVAISEADNKIKELTKTKAHHKTEQERLDEALAKALIKTNEAADSQDKLAAAHKAGGDEVIHLTAEMKAESDLISKGMLPSMQGWTKALEDATAANERLARSTGSAKIEENINKINQQADAQLKINAAFDGSEESITHATNAQKAYADAVAAGIAPGDQFNDVVAREAAALDRASEATQNLADQRRALSELSSMFTRAFNTISDAIVNAMFAGKDAVIDFGRVAKAIAQQILSAFLQLAVLNPLLNALFGQRLLTLGGAFGAFGGGGGGAGSGTDMLGNALMVGGVGNQLAGGGGLFGGVGSSVGTFLVGNAGLGAGDAAAEAAMLSASNFGFGAVPAAGLEGAGATSGIIGSGGALAPALAAGGTIAGGALGGFALGTLGGNMLAKSLNKAPGPNPMIGAGAGAGIGALIGTAIVPIIGTAIGALIGGIVGGLGGGAIGPRPASPFSSIPLSIGPGGQLQASDLISQKIDAQALATNTFGNVTWMNAVMGAHGLGVAGLGGISQIGSNTPGGFQDPTKAADFATAFTRMQFTQAGPGGAVFQGRTGFTGIQQLSDTAVAVEQFVAVMEQTKAADRISDFLGTLGSVATADIPAKLSGIVTFVTDTVPKLLGEQNIGSLNAAVAQITATFAPAVQMAQELSYKEAELTAARDKQVAAAIEAIQSQEAINNQGLRVRYATGLAQITGDTAQVAAAQLQAFDLNAEQQRMQMSQHLKEVYGETIAQTQYYADVMGLLEQALGVERIAVQKQFNATSVDLEKQRLEAMRSMQQLESRYQTARAQVTGSPQDAFAAQLYAFDIQAQAAHTDMSQQLIAALVGGQDFANRMAALEKALGVERLAIVTQFNRQMTAAWESNFRIAENLATRRVNAMATLGQVTPQQAQLYSFDVSARQQRVDLTNQLVSSFGEAYKATADYAARSAQLEQTLADERLAIQKQFNDQATNAATGVITSLAEYARGLQFSAATPLSPQAQYAQATSQFNAVSGAAIAGDFTSIQKLQSFSDAFLNASRGVYGSGAGYAADFQRVINALNAVGSIQPDTMTAAVYTAEMRTQTQQLVDSQSNLAKLLQSILTSLEQGKNAPARAAA